MILLTEDDETDAKRRRKRQLIEEPESRIVRTPGFHFLPLFVGDCSKKLGRFTDKSNLSFLLKRSSFFEALPLNMFG